MITTIDCARSIYIHSRFSAVDKDFIFDGMNLTGQLYQYKQTLKYAYRGLKTNVWIMIKKFSEIYQ